MREENQVTRLSKPSSFASFIAVGFVGVVMTEIGVFGLFGKMGVTYIISKIIVAVPISVWNFVGRKWVVSNGK